jgi:hypothetical protein
LGDGGCDGLVDGGVVVSGLVPNGVGHDVNRDDNDGGLVW